MSTTRIDVILTFGDTRSRERAREFKNLGAQGLTDVVIVDSYITDMVFSIHESSRVLSAFVNPHMEKGAINGVVLDVPFAVAIEIAYLPGVTDNVATTALETISDVTGKSHKGMLSSARVYALYGKLSSDDIEKIKKSLLSKILNISSFFIFFK